MEKNKQKKYAMEIYKASKNNRLVFFVGAGVSMISNYPQWWELVNKFYIELYGEEKEVYTQDELLRTPQIFFDVKGAEQYNKILKEIFDVERDVNDIHEKIVALRPYHIMTTNYDDLIEKVWYKRGQYFSLISADQDVAAAVSDRSLIKIHGDFKRGFYGENIVLKESDYMNYEQNFPLISNLTKNIIATHTVVFIGYSLRDYNINLLLNWVKHIQGDSFNSPFFIRTDPDKIEENDITYYSKRGIKIIDSASIFHTEKNDYFTRYAKVLDYLLETRDNDLIGNPKEAITFVYNKLLHLSTIKYLRREDLDSIFNNDYHFMMDGRVVRNNLNGYDYLLNVIKMDKIQLKKLKQSLREKHKFIIDFLNKFNVMSYTSHEEEYEISNYANTIHYKVDNPIYHNDYQEIRKRIECMDEKLLENQFHKAFFLTKLGQWTQAYDIYTEILNKAKDETNQWVHYMAQLNRFRLYQAILYRRYDGLFSVEFLDRIENEMQGFKLDEAFSSMPYTFKNRFPNLENLSKIRLLDKDTVSLFEDYSRLELQKSTDSITFGITISSKIGFQIRELIRFYYENYIWMMSYKEVKFYIKEALKIQIEKSFHERTLENTNDKLSHHATKDNFFIDYFDFINICRSFDMKDIRYIEKYYKIDGLRFEDTDLIQQYLLDTTKIILDYFKSGVNNELLISQVYWEAINSFYLSKYINLNSSLYSQIIEAIVCSLNYNTDYEIKMVCINQLIKRNTLTESVIKILENYIVTLLKLNIDKDHKEAMYGSRTAYQLINLIKKHKPEYTSSTISRLIMNSHSINIENGRSIYKIIDSDAKEYLLSKFNWGNNHLKKFLIEYESANIELTSLSKYQAEITEYLEMNKDIPHNLLTLQFASFYFMGYLTDPIMEKYMGTNEEYDMFVDPANFDYSMFRASWLHRYSEELLTKIANNQFMRGPIIELLKERIQSENNREYIQLLVKYFI
ncbi:hypothetical protein D3C74_186670 [compost metagenome]